MSPEQFLQIADMLPDTALLVSGDGVVIAANRRAERRLAVPSRSLAGKRLDSLVADSPPRVAELLGAYSRSRDPVPGRVTLRLPDGTLLPCRAEGGVLQPREGDTPAVVFLRLSARDETPTHFAILSQRIDELNREIARRIRVERELREQREWLRVTLSSIGDGVIATDSRGLVRFLNPVAESLTGWTREEAVGRPMKEVFRIVNEETRRPVENPVDRVLAEGRVVGLANHSLLVARDGREWPIADSAAPIRSDEGEVLGVVLVFLETTERRRTEEQLRRQARSLAEADRRKDDFLAVLAHELRNPLGAVSNALHVMEEAGPQSRVFERAREIAHRQIRHQTRMVDDLLDVSRITRGTFVLHRERLDLDRLCRQAVDDCRSAFVEARIALSYSGPEEPVSVDGDAVRLSQAIVNLLSNARKFTPEGGAVRIALRVDAPAGRAVLTVSDTGAGIDPQLLPHIFEPFRQGPQSLARSGGGLGLGLALVHGVAAGHGGDVTASSRADGQGAIFTVTLPTASWPAETSAILAPAVAPGAPCLRVLIIEDLEDAVETLRDLLELWGHEVRIASTGPAGLRAAAEFRPHVVLCDIGLPELDGYSVAEALRQNPDTAGACLVATTGYGQEQDRARSAAAGFDAHLAKPLDVEQLRRILETCPSGEADERRPSGA